MKNLKVLMLNGSPHVNGNTAVALREMEEIFKASGVEVETVLIGNQAVRGCTACGACGKLGKCVFDDVVNELKPKFEEADGLVVASPVYYASANATLIACLDRLFYSTPFDKTMKVGASVVCARAAAAARRRSMSSTSISPSPACRSRPASTGTVSTAAHRARRSRTERAGRRCARSRAT